MCSRGERKQDACTRVSQDETWPEIPSTPQPPNLLTSFTAVTAGAPLPPAATHPPIHSSRPQKRGKPCHTALSNTKTPCPKLSDDWTDLRRPSVAKESNEKALGWEFCMQQSSWNYSKTSLKSCFRNHVGLVGETSAQGSYGSGCKAGC